MPNRYIYIIYTEDEWQFSITCINSTEPVAKGPVRMNHMKKIRIVGKDQQNQSQRTMDFGRITNGCLVISGEGQMRWDEMKIRTLILKALFVVWCWWYQKGSPAQLGCNPLFLRPAEKGIVVRWMQTRESKCKSSELQKHDYENNGR